MALSIVCGVVAVDAAPQTPPPRDASRPAQASTARIRGRIVALDTGQPLGRAQVTLGGAGLSPPRRTLTDDEGRYEFTDVPAGSFIVTASKTGYITLQYGQRRPFEPGRQVIVSGASVERVDVTLSRGAVIAVRLTDDLGFPIAGVDVSASRYVYRADGQRSLTTVYGNPPGPSTTDDRGELRLFGLMPGEYVVSALSRTGAASGTVSATSEGYVPTYYPGVITPSQAAPVSVRLGEETSLQFSLVRSRLARVSGIVVDPQGRPANGARVSLSAQTPILLAGGANIGVDGTFSMGDVPPGEYTVVVVFDAYEQIGPTLTITGLDVSDLRIAVGQGTTVSGRLVFEGGVPPKGAQPPFRVALIPVRSVSPGPLGPQRTTVPDEENRFGFTGITGRVIVSASSPDGWMTKSVVVDGQDFTHSSLDVRDRATVSNVVVTLTNRLTTLRGQVMDAGAQPTRDYVVVVVPAETYEAPIMNQRVRALRPGPDATFTTRGMMPGRYMAVAVEALEDSRQFAPEFQQQVRRLGQEFSIREGEAATLNLRLTPDL